MAPISVRSKTEKGDMGNQVAAMIAPLGTHIEDPAERLRYVYDKTSNSKAMTNAIGARTMTEVSKVSPALYMAMGAQLFSRVRLAHRVMPFNTVVTNVPGPPVHIYSTGARLESMALSLICLTDGMGLAHVVQSYVDEAYISFTACRDIVPDPEFYAECLQESFEEMLAQAKLVGSAPAAKPAAQPAAAKKPAARKPAAKKSAARKAAAKPAAKTAAKTPAARKPAAKPAKRKPLATTRKIESKPAK
jgi:hypothetical protein